MQGTKAGTRIITAGRIQSRVARARRSALIELIRASGLDVSSFATQVMGRSPSTVYRWLSREQDVPKVVADWLMGEHARAIAEAVANSNEVVEA